MSNFPSDFSQVNDTIDPTKLGPYGHQAMQKLSDAGYEVRYGLTKEYAHDIINLALEPGIKEFCPNDSGKRFKDIEATQKWLSKCRATYLMLKIEGDSSTLVGYGWVGPGSSEIVPGGENVFAIRIGQNGQGQGLATPFARMIVSGSAIINDATNIWLETWQSNAGAVHVYHKIGFVDVAKEEDVRPSALGEVNDTRLYMLLDNDLLNP